MKKRSLVAAIAMLIVSALVLTSATYAWFAGTATVSVDDVVASVSAQTGGLWLSTSASGPWDTNISRQELAAVNTNKVGTYDSTNSTWTNVTLVPVSYDPSSADQNVFAGGLTLDSTAGSATEGKYLFATPGTTTSGYVEYTLYIKSDDLGADVDHPVDVDVTLGLSTDYNFVQAAVVGTQDGSDLVPSRAVSKTAGYAYIPVTAATAAGPDSDGDGIIENGEWNDATYFNNGTAVTTVASGNANATITLHFYEGHAVQQVVVRMWAEGQNPACTGTVDAGTSTATLAVAYAS